MLKKIRDFIVAPFTKGRKLFKTMFVGKKMSTIVQSAIAITATITMLITDSLLVMLIALGIMIVDTIIACSKMDKTAMNNISLIANWGSVVQNVKSIIISLRRGEIANAAISAFSLIFDIIRNKQITDVILADDGAMAA